MTENPVSKNELHLPYFVWSESIQQKIDELWRRQPPYWAFEYVGVDGVLRCPENAR